MRENGQRTTRSAAAGRARTVAGCAVTTAAAAAAYVWIRSRGELLPGQPPCPRCPRPPGPPPTAMCSPKVLLALAVISHSHTTLAIAHAGRSCLSSWAPAWPTCSILATRARSASRCSLFICVSMSVSAFPVLAQILTDRQIRTQIGLLATWTDWLFCRLIVLAATAAASPPRGRAA